MLDFGWVILSLLRLGFFLLSFLYPFVLWVGFFLFFWTWLGWVGWVGRYPVFFYLPILAVEGEFGMDGWGAEAGSGSQPFASCPCVASFLAGLFLVGIYEVDMGFVVFALLERTLV